jgi:hypothetical protein
VANDGPEKDAAVRPGEAEDEEDLEGHGGSRWGLRPDPEVGKPESIEDDQPDPVENGKWV